MKGTLALCILVALATISDTAVVKTSNRSNLSVGNYVPGDRLLYRSYIYQPPIPNVVQYQDVIYRGNVTTRITSVLASEVGSTQWATAYIIGGGVGQNNVTVRFTSSRGYGYYYLLDIWGR